MRTTEFFCLVAESDDISVAHSEKLWDSGRYDIKPTNMGDIKKKY